MKPDFEIYPYPDSPEKSNVKAVSEKAKDYFKEHDLIERDNGCCPFHLSMNDVGELLTDLKFTIRFNI